MYKVSKLCTRINEAMSVDEVVAKIDAVSLDDMLRIAGDMLSRDRARIAAVGPAGSARGLESLL